MFELMENLELIVGGCDKCSEHKIVASNQVFEEGLPSVVEDEATILESIVAE